MAKWSREWVRDRVRVRARAGARECNTSFFVAVLVTVGLQCTTRVYVCLRSAIYRNFKLSERISYLHTC